MKLFRIGFFLRTAMAGVAFAGAFASTAGAQGFDGSAYAFAVPDFGPSMSALVLGSGPAPAGASDANAARTLHFASAPAAHESVVANVADFLAHGDRAKVPDIRRTLASSDVLGQFDSVLQQYGWSKDDLADVYAAYLVMSWEVINGGDATEHAPGIAAVRAKVRQALAANAKLRGLGDADKQKAAETLAYLAIIASASQDALTGGGDAARLAQLRAGVGKTTAGVTHMNLKGVRLTDTGFSAAGK
jgi:hypothetical protein